MARLFTKNVAEC